MAKHSGKIIFVILFGIIIIQTTFIPQLSVYKIVPNLAVSFLAALAVIRKKNIFKMAFLTGLILDVFSGLSFGIITTSLILSVFVISVLSSKFLKNPEVIVLALIAFLGVITYNLVLFTLANLSSLSIILDNTVQILLIIGLKIIFETVMALMFYKFALKLNGQ